MSGTENTKKYKDQDVVEFLLKRKPGVTTGIAAAAVEKIRRAIDEMDRAMEEHETEKKRG